MHVANANRYFRGSLGRFGGGFGSFQIVPPALVGAVQSALISQGMDPSIIGPDGSINPTALITLGFDTMTIRSTAFAPIVINLRGPSDPNTALLIQQLQPAVTLSGRAGTVTIAPSGEPGGISNLFANLGGELGIGAIAAIGGLLLLGGALFGK